MTLLSISTIVTISVLTATLAAATLPLIFNISNGYGQLITTSVNVSEDLELIPTVNVTEDLDLQLIPLPYCDTPEGEAAPSCHDRYDFDDETGLFPCSSST